MKYSLLFSLVFLLAFEGFSQSGIYYQAVVRDAGGTILNNIPVEVDVTLIPSSGSAYTEQISSSTNDFGILNIVIGENGNMPLKDFNWEFGNVTMDLEIQAGAKTIVLKDQMVQNVPYAYYAHVAQRAIEDEVDDSDADSTNELQTLSFDTISRSLTLSKGNSVIISDKINDDDADPTNEIQTIEFNSITRELSISDGDTVTIEDQVDDADADPMNEIQSLSYDTLNNSLVLSDGGTVDLLSFVSHWRDTSQGIYTMSDAFIGMPTDSPNLRLSPDTINFLVKQGEVTSTWTPDHLSFESDNFDAILKNKSISIDGLIGPFRYTNVMDTFGFSSTADIFNERSTQVGGNFTATKLPESDNIFSQLNTNGLVIRNGGQSTNLDLNELSIGGMFPNDYAKLFGGGYGVLSLYNNSNNNAVLLTAEPGPGELTLNSASGNDVQSVFNHSQWMLRDMGRYVYLNKNQLVFGEDGLGDYAVLRGDGSGRMTLYNGANWPAVFLSTQSGAGELIANDPVGNANVEIDANTFLSPSTGRLRIYQNGDDRFQATSTTSGAGGAMVYGQNGGLNIILSHLASFSNYGYIGVYDGSTIQAGMHVNTSGEGRIFADVKNFKMEHPDKPGTSIWYACVEGPEVAAYDRGTATLSNGKVKIKFSDHFKIVANPETMTVMLTPHSADTYGLAVVEKTEDGFVVQEFKGGKGNFSFDWEVKCKRRGYEDWKVEQNDADYMPASQTTINNK